MTEQMTPDEVLAAVRIELCAAMRDGDDPWDYVEKHPVVKRFDAAVAALIAERDGYKAAWWDVVEMLGGKMLPDISNAQYHASVLVPKLRELIARNAELEADAARYRFLKKSRPVLLLTALFGNGCRSRTTADADAFIDAARAEAGHG